MRIVYYIFVVLTLFVNDLSSQQRQMYTQFMYNKIGLNPAYAGNDPYSAATVIYRNQWLGFPGAPDAQLFTLNSSRIAKKIGLGLHFERQSIGITDKISIEGMYAYKFLLGNGTLSMGMSLSARNYNINYLDTRLFGIHDIKLDPSIPQEVISVNKINSGFGIYFNTSQFYLGLSAPRLIKSDLDFDQNNFFSSEIRHAFLMGGGEFKSGLNTKILPQILVKFAENAPLSIDLNTIVKWNEIYMAGLTYRTGGTFGESIDVILGLQVTDRLVFGFAYDIPLSGLNVASNGSLEVMLYYAFLPKKSKTVIINPRYF